MRNLLATIRKRVLAESNPPYNSVGYCVTPTPDETGCALHPDVVDFERAWNGYRYWMVYTPYYGNNFRIENPCVVASNDGVIWVVPSGASNPLFPAPENVNEWNSDPDLNYDPVTGELILVWRGGDLWPHISRSSDGVNWSEPATAILPGVAVTDEVASPSLVKVGNVWYLWGVTHPSRVLTRWQADAPEGPWSDPVVCSGFGPNLWHLNVIRAGQRYLMIAHEGWTAETGGSTTYAASSLEGVSWDRNPVPILVPSGAGWDGVELYRGAMTLHDDGIHMRVWYSGRSGAIPKDWHIGLVNVPLIEWSV